MLKLRGKAPKFYLGFLILMSIFILSLFTFLFVIDNIENAIFVICMIQYYGVASILVLGFVKVFCSVISLLLI
jgi:hypothetical protein